MFPALVAAETGCTFGTKVSFLTFNLFSRPTLIMLHHLWWRPVHFSSLVLDRTSTPCSLRLTLCCVHAFRGPQSTASIDDNTVFSAMQHNASLEVVRNPKTDTVDWTAQRFDFLFVPFYNSSQEQIHPLTSFYRYRILTVNKCLTRRDNYFAKLLLCHEVRDFTICNTR